MAPKISVLMPSLNVGAYIDQCMESVLSQTFTDIEVICIDAGSTDGTLERLRHYAEADERVSVLVSEVKSYGHQMNMGLDAARGEYIGVVETDDWAEPDMFERLYQAAVDNDADLVKANFFNYWTSPELRDEPVSNLAKCPLGVVFSPLDHRDLFFVASSIWSGLYRRQMLVNNGIRFNETPGASYQDTAFFFMVCSVARRTYLLEDAVLHYRRDNESSSVNSGSKVYFICDEMRHYEAFLDKHPDLKEELQKTLVPVKLVKYLWNYNRLDPQFQREFFEHMHREFLADERGGLVDEALFEKVWYTRLRQIIDNPTGYFAATCKPYAVRAQGGQLPGARELTPCTGADVTATVVYRVGPSADAAPEGLRAALGQDLGGIEVVCVCDGVADDMRDSLVAMAADDPRLRVLAQPDEGASAAWNHGLAAARGRYVLFLDEGDVLREDALGLLVAAADEAGAEVALADTSPMSEGASPIATLEAGEQGGCLPLLSQAGLHDAASLPLLVRRALLEGAGLRFADGCGFGELLMDFEALAAASRAVFVRGDLVAREEGPTRDFRHLYGGIRCLGAIQELAGELPRNARFQATAASTLEALCRELELDYDSLKDDAMGMALLTPVERLALRSAVNHASVTRNNAALDAALRREQAALKREQEALGREQAANRRADSEAKRAAVAESRARKAKARAERAAERERAVRDSHSFKIGHALMSPLHAIRKLGK